MTPEQQRIAIAEACGIVSKDKWGSLYKTPRGILRDCPDYLNDLNAMHEAEKVLTPLEWFNYSALLTKIVGPKDQEYYLNIHATAAQRAEAFLRTIDKWKTKENKP